MIDAKIFTRFALMCSAAFALGAATLMTSCTKDGDEEPAVPVITITTQPTAPADLTEGSITGSLTVEATVTEGATLTYQWYTNTTASNEGGAAVSGATGVSFTIPTDLAVGTYYYFCVVSAERAESVRTNVVTVSIAPLPLNGRITWKDGKYALTTDPTDAGLLFMFGSVVGLFSGNGAVLTLPATDFEDEFDAGDIAWNPAGTTAWADLTLYAESDYPAAVDAAYHTAANVKAGKGDPCRLVGLDLAKIESTAAAQLTAGDIDNGLWRLPTNAENKAFLGDSKWGAGGYWTTLNDVPGGMFPDATAGSAATFLPATGSRNVATGLLTDVGSGGDYWSGTPYSSADGYSLAFGAGGVSPSSYGVSRGYGFAVRCVSQK